MARINTLVGQGHKIGVLIIDEPEPKPPVADADVKKITRDQQTLLAFANGQGCKFWRIELSQRGIAGEHPTSLRLRGFLPPDTPVVTKKHLNAFTETNLAGQLQTAGVTHVVVLGHETNCCVKQTAVGGPPKPERDPVAGATQLGYTVLTSPLVLKGRDAPKWTGEAKTEFYAKL